MVKDNTYNFSFAKPPSIIFGEGKLKLLPELISAIGKKVLIITGKSSFLNSGKWDSLSYAFKDKRIDYQIIRVSIEPTPELIDEITGQFKNSDINVVVSIGGGSAIDTGKAVSAMLPMHNSVLNFLEGVGNKKHDGRKVPFIAVPTTSGTGSEATKNAVISKIGSNGFKKSLRHDNFVPDIAIVDPELTYGCPSEITAACGMDALTQLLESYTSIQANILTDSLALPAIKCIIQSLVLACQSKQIEFQARKELSYGALISGITLANAGLGTVHGFASTIGGMFEIPHGVVCGSLMVPVTTMNIEKLIISGSNKCVLNKYAQVGRLFSNTENQGDEFYAKLLGESIRKMAVELKLQRLGDFGIKSEHLEKIAKETDNKYNPVELSTDDLINALKECL